jgi:hypothetical protein
VSVSDVLCNSQKKKWRSEIDIPCVTSNRIPASSIYYSNQSAELFRKLMLSSSLSRFFTMTCRGGLTGQAEATVVSHGRPHTLNSFWPKNHSSQAQPNSLTKAQCEATGPLAPLLLLPETRPEAAAAAQPYDATDPP